MPITGRMGDVLTVLAMPENVQEGTDQDEQPRQQAQHMDAVLVEQHQRSGAEETGDADESERGAPCGACR